MADEGDPDTPADKESSEPNDLDTPLSAAERYKLIQSVLPDMSGFPSTRAAEDKMRDAFRAQIDATHARAAAPYQDLVKSVNDQAKAPMTELVKKINDQAQAPYRELMKSMQPTKTLDIARTLYEQAAKDTQVSASARRLLESINASVANASLAASTVRIQTADGKEVRLKPSHALKTFDDQVKAEHLDIPKFEDTAAGRTALAAEATASTVETLVSQVQSQIEEAGTDRRFDRITTLVALAVAVVSLIIAVVAL